MHATAAPLAPAAAPDECPALKPSFQPGFIVDGDRLTLVDTGAGRLLALIDLIDRATKSLRILFYIYADDAAGRRMLDALTAAARRGVTVRVVIDSFGSDASSEFFRPLEEAGGSMCWFAPRWGRHYLLRNHQKLALADAEGPEPRAITGGFNVENCYLGDDPADCWRDLGILVEGRAAARLARYFDALDEWVRAPRPGLRRLNRIIARCSEEEGKLRWLIGGPSRRLSPWARAVRSDLRRARRIDIVAGYFTPSPTMLRRLDRAGREGRKVRVITASKSDNHVTVAAARFTYAGLLRKGVRVFEYLPVKLHTKLYAADDAVHVGSANFDMRSLFVNLELMLRVEDAAFARHVRTYVDGEIAQSDEITPEDYRARTGSLTRARQFLAYLLVAVVDPSVSRGLNLRW